MQGFIAGKKKTLWNEASVRNVPVFVLVFRSSQISVSYATSAPMALTMSLGDSKSLPAFSETLVGKNTIAR